MGTSLTDLFRAETEFAVKASEMYAVMKIEKLWFNYENPGQLNIFDRFKGGVKGCRR